MGCKRHALLGESSSEGDSPIWGLSSDHRGVAFVVAWVVNLNVGFGLTLGLTTLMSHIGANE